MKPTLSICVLSFARRIIIKNMVQYVDVILLFVSKTSAFDSLNSQYLEKYLDLSESILCVSQIWYS